MNRSATDVLRRGLDSMLANWPLLLLRFAEKIVMLLAVVMAVVAFVVPAGISLGMSDLNVDSDNPAPFFYGLLLDHWMLLILGLVLLLVLITVAIMLHSFVDAGSAAIYIEAERAADVRTVVGRQRFHVFSIDRWFAGARHGWWVIFWIYNLAWLVASIAILIPVAMVGALMLALHGATPALVLGCLVLVVVAFFGLFICIATALWVEKAIVVAMARPLDARASLREAWREIRADLARHAIVAVILMVITIGGSGVFAMISSGGPRIPSHNDLASIMSLFTLAFLPLQIVASLASSAFSSAMSGWSLASFTALTVPPSTGPGVDPQS